MPSHFQGHFRSTVQSSRSDANALQSQYEYSKYKCSFCHDWLEKSFFSATQLRLVKERHEGKAIDPTSPGMVCRMHEHGARHETLYQCKGPCSRHQSIDCYTSRHRDTNRFICHDCHKIFLLRKQKYWVNEHGARQEYPAELPNRDDPMTSGIITFLDIKRRYEEEVSTSGFLNHVVTNKAKTFLPPLNPNFKQFEREESYVSGASIAKAFLEKVGYLPSKAESSPTHGSNDERPNRSDRGERITAEELHPVLYSRDALDYDL